MMTPLNYLSVAAESRWKEMERDLSNRLDGCAWNYYCLERSSQITWRGDFAMRFVFSKSVFLGVIVVVMASCSAQQEQRPEQSALVTAANETAAMARLRVIAAAQARYMVESGGDYGTLDQLIEKRYANDPSSGKLPGYRFDVQVRRGGFQATAVPQKYGITGKRSFYVDENNVIHAADKKGAPATASDPEA